MLQLIEFVKKEYEGPKYKFIFISILGTLSFACVVALVDKAADISSQKSTVIEGRLFLMCIIACIILLICKHFTLTNTTKAVERITHKIRMRLVDQVRQTELHFLEKLDKGDLYARIAQDTGLISLLATDVVNAVETSFVCIFICLYTAYLSIEAFLFIILFMVALGTILFFKYSTITEKLNSAKKKEARLFNLLNDMLFGFKEIRLNTKKNEALFRDIVSLTEETEELKIGLGTRINDNIILSFCFYEILLACIVFIIPLINSQNRTQNEIIAKIVAVMIFIFGLLLILSRGINAIILTNAAVMNLNRLEKSITCFETGCPQMTKTITQFKKISLKGLNFQYTGNDEDILFKFGPISLDILQGEVIFIVGGNGSGKSTLLKLLTGLYYPFKGHIALDDIEVTKDAYQSYRELFSIIFTDFHLFKKLYGLEDMVDEQRVNDLLKEMDIHTKTDYRNGRFSNINLSTGQRKRVAYIASMLEDKPIYVFDEWAADQDPLYRKLFYEKLLHDLRIMNKTVIVVTHDDRYFHNADVVYKMEEGKIVKQ